MSQQPNLIATAYEKLCAQLFTEPRTWLITGVAGFIGSNLLETLLKLDQRVVGLDNFSTGHLKNLSDVQTISTSEQWANFHFIEGDIRDLDDCRRAMAFPGKDDKSEATVEYVLHQAALGSVPRSLADPITTNASNITGFLNILVAARDAKVQSFTYAASSSTYGDHPGLPKIESVIGKPLSPYAVTKYVNELYAEVFSRSYEIGVTGLRYFNVFGPRQDPLGSYAAVIPKWIRLLIDNEIIQINGDGSTSRDFCFIENVVQANILAAVRRSRSVDSQVYNVALGDSTSLLELFEKLRMALERNNPKFSSHPAIFRDFRAGDVRHSRANIDKAKEQIGYEPKIRIDQGLEKTVSWHLGERGKKNSQII